VVIKEIKRRNRVVVIFPTTPQSIARLVRAVLLEQNGHCHLEGRRMNRDESMIAIPKLGDMPALLATRA
jgi:transposase-like protein